jgi:hypothetical protein
MIARSQRSRRLPLCSHQHVPEMIALMIEPPDVCGADTFLHLP